MDPLERCILKHPSRSWHLICSLLPRRWQAVHRPSSTRLLWPQSTHLLFQPSAEADKIVFYSVYQPGRRGARGGGREWGVLWRRNAIHIMSGTLTFQRSRNACKPQTSGKMWTPGTWQLTPINSEIRARKCGIRNPTHNLSATFQHTQNANQPTHPKFSKSEVVSNNQ